MTFPLFSQGNITSFFDMSILSNSNSTKETKALSKVSVQVRIILEKKSCFMWLLHECFLKWIIKFTLLALRRKLELSLHNDSTIVFRRLKPINLQKESQQNQSLSFFKRALVPDSTKFEWLPYFGNINSYVTLIKRLPKIWPFAFSFFGII